VSVLTNLHSWPVPTISAVGSQQLRLREVRSKNDFMSFLGQHQAQQAELLQSLSNRSDTEELGFTNVLFYQGVIENLALSVTSAVQSRAYPGFMSKAYAVDCLLSSAVSLTPVRALGAVFYFRGSPLDGQEFATYIAYSQLFKSTLVESSDIDSEVSRTMTSAINGVNSFIKSLAAVIDEIDARMIYIPRRSVVSIVVSSKCSL
jgi:hypothetical protein